MNYTLEIKYILLIVFLFVKIFRILPFKVHILLIKLEIYNTNSSFYLCNIIIVLHYVVIIQINNHIKNAIHYIDNITNIKIHGKYTYNHF